jgi:hypothetical protein
MVGSSRKPPPSEKDAPEYPFDGNSALKAIKLLRVNMVSKSINFFIRVSISK